MSVSFTWFAVDRHDRICRVSTSPNGPWPFDAAVLDTELAPAIESVLWELEDGPIDFEHDTYGTYVWEARPTRAMTAAELAPNAAEAVRRLRLDIDALHDHSFSIWEQVPEHRIEDGAEVGRGPRSLTEAPEPQPVATELDGLLANNGPRVALRPRRQPA